MAGFPPVRPGLLLLSVAVGILSCGLGAEHSGLAAKRFKLSAEEIVERVPGRGGAIASDRITVEGLPVRFMYREEPDNDFDSGWRFLSGTEDDAYMADASNHAVYDVNTIANYDRSIIPYVDAPTGSAFEKLPDMQDFVAVDDWEPGD